MIHYITTQGLGQPWVGNELRVVASAGVPFVLHALRSPRYELFESDWALQLNSETRILYPLPALQSFVSFLLAPVLFGRRFAKAFLSSLFGERENLRARLATIGHLYVACHWARALRRESVTHIHAQWAHSSASVGMYGAWLLGRSFSFTGHAVDLFRDRVALKDKIRRATFIICISEFHRRFYLREGACEDQLHIAYCGINPEAFHFKRRQRGEGEPFQIRAAGRLVEKKGFAYLIEACSILAARNRSFHCVIAGSGRLEDKLQAKITRLGLEGKVTVTGKPLTQEAIPAFMHEGDVFVLPCVWSNDNDVDGLPQLTMEAMACGLPAITTRLVGNPDLVVDGETGLLVEPRDAAALADAISDLMDDSPRVDALAEAGRRYVEKKFDIHRSLQPLIALFRSVLSIPSNAQGLPTKGGQMDPGNTDAQPIEAPSRTSQ